MQKIWNNKPLLRFLQKRYLENQSKKGINFKQTVSFWNSKQQTLHNIESTLKDKTISYPSYYTEPIHTYENGHLNWMHSYQTSCHMQVSALISLPDIVNNEDIYYTPSDAYVIYKNHIFTNILYELKDVNITSIADFGCGTGDLTAMLYSEYKNIVGVDLSPNHLSIAQFKYKNINFIHSNIENTQFDDNTFDAIVINFAFHEMIPSAIENTIKEAHRVLKENGKLVIIDMNPELLPVYPSFIDISEPHLKDYRNVDICGILKQYNFSNVQQRKLHKMTSTFVGIKHS